MNLLKTILMSVTGMALMEGCTGGKQDVPSENIAAIIIALETNALEEWNKGNPSAYLDLYAGGITYFDPTLAKRMDGLEKIKAYYEPINGIINVERYEMIDPLVNTSGTMAVLSYNLASYGKDGTVYKWNCTEVYRLESSNQWKIVHNHWSYVQPGV